MLNGISSLISPSLLAAMHEMGHGDEIVLADGNFPGYTIGPKILRADGLKVAQLLDAILPLFELDSYAVPLVMMQVQPGDTLDPAVEQDYMAAVRRHHPATPAPDRIDRFDFYKRAEKAFAIVLTGETRTYGNLILKKGIIRER